MILSLIFCSVCFYLCSLQSSATRTHARATLICENVAMMLPSLMQEPDATRLRSTTRYASFFIVYPPYFLKYSKSVLFTVFMMPNVSSAGISFVSIFLIYTLPFLYSSMASSSIIIGSRFIRYCFILSPPKQGERG